MRAALAVATDRFGTIRTLFPGVGLALTIAFAATFVSEHNGGPQLLYALFFGIAFHFLSGVPKCQPGIEFASKTMLRFGVALLGARITIGQIAALGLGPIAIVLAAVPLTIGCGVMCAKLFGRTREEGLLSGGAVAICGASAALAIAAVLPRSKENDRLTIFTVVGITGLSTLAMIFYPTLANSLHLDPALAGLFLGGTIHDVAQVVGAGYTISPVAGDIATFVKLLRVLTLVPVVLVFSLMYREARGTESGRRLPLVPSFLVAFALFVAANSAGAIPRRIDVELAALSRWCLVTAIAALGVKTSFQHFAELGWRPMAMMVINTLFLATFVLAFVVLERGW